MWNIVHFLKMGNASLGIVHEGIVTGVDRLRGVVRVAVDTREDSCSGCAASAVCSARKGMQIEVSAGSVHINPGDRVEVVYSAKMHHTAVFICFILPLMLALAIVFLLLEYTDLPEIVVAGVCLLTVAGVYWLTGLFKHRFATEPAFRLSAASQRRIQSRENTEHEKPNTKTN